MTDKFPHNDIITLLDQNLKFNLAESTSEDLLLGDILNNDLLQLLRQTKLGYGTSQGSQSLRNLVATKLNVAADKVLITNGASAAIFLSLLSLCNKGDEVITVNPNFPPTLDVISAIGAVRKIVEINFDNGYQFSSNEFGKQLTKQTKLIILVSPHNPSGTAMKDETVKEILLMLECPTDLLPNNQMT